MDAHISIVYPLYYVVTCDGRALVASDSVEGIASSEKEAYLSLAFDSAKLIKDLVCFTRQRGCFWEMDGRQKGDQNKDDLSAGEARQHSSAPL